VKVPDFVTDEEALLRLLWNPEGFDENGDLTPQALRREDFSGRSCEGMSVNRAEYSEPTDLQCIAIGQSERMPDGKVTPYFGRILVHRARLDSLVDVISDKENNPEFHALIVSKEKIGKGRQKQIRLHILKQIYDVTPLHLK